jgi:deoxyribose-phosphate aldolase
MAIARYIDHTQLHPAASLTDIHTLCQEALDFDFKAVCVPGSRLGIAREMVSDSGVRLAAVVGFPHGNASTEAKCCEATAYLQSGADELDIVVNLGWLKSGKLENVAEELKRLRAIAPDNVLKLILETCYLEEGEKVLACELARKAGWDFVKTSTGFGTGGATLSDVKLMKKTVGDTVQVKASGGIRDYQTALKFLEAGASRIGTSSGPAIARGENKETA